jgi:TRAP-type C4-dicarboxylate transport system substrate-binding protein
MRSTGLCALLLGLTAAASAAAIASDAVDTALKVAVVAPEDDDHFAWAAARQLVLDAAGKGIALTVAPAPLAGTSGTDLDLLVMPVRSLATQVPAFEVLELPFFYPSLAAVRFDLDGALGQRLDAEASRRGWKIAAFWDEGMHILSGLKRYDRVRNLKAREFLITRPDPVAERQFRYWKADPRRIDPEDREAVLRECLIASRAVTLQEVQREQLYRVHLALSITNHRYEGWVVIVPLERWKGLDAQTREALEGILRQTTEWQRRDAEERGSAARAELKRLGMTIYEVDADEREAFRAALPDWSSLLSEQLSEETRRELVALALAGTTAFASAASGPAASNPGDHPAPDSGGRQEE